MSNIRWFKELTIKDVPLVGGKNASLGEMYQKLKKKGVPVPNGFALTASAYREFLTHNKLDKRIKQALKGLDVKNVRALSAAGKRVRTMILAGEFPLEMKKEILGAYKKLSADSHRPLAPSSGRRGNATDVAVRSSATAEDLPDASFAGQQETYLNVVGEKALLDAVRKCLASLFTDRAISYREAKGFDHFAVALSVGVQKMVRSDVGSSGVMFTLDTESGFNGVVLINAAYGLGEYVVKGRVTPDQFFVFKDGVKRGFKSIVSRRLGTKDARLVYGKGGGTRSENVKMSDQKKFCITEDQVITLAKWGVKIEEHYGHAMDIEWALDGQTNELFIVQARSETVKGRSDKTVIETYRLKSKSKILATGISVGQKIGQGRVRIINSPKQMKQFKAGEVLVTRITDPDWEPIMRVASAIITEQGGKTSHAAIVSRELGVPCIVGAVKARQLLKQGQEVTASCADGEIGYIYQGHLPFEVEKTELKNLSETKTKIMMNVGNPDSAFSLANIPCDGVGLAREEFIFTNFIKIHPLALINFDKLTDHAVKTKINELTLGYTDKKQVCIDKLAEGIAFIATAFYPHDVIVRLSDFKTNEYATLIGGKDFEPKEENPMIGWRGASRYYDPKYKPGFALECAAFKKARETWGLKNIIVMVPFCRTVEEGKKVLAVMKEYGLERGKDGLQVYVMCEIPSNVILAKEFSEIFDGFSIGSNDLTQLTLGVDRDSQLVAHVYDENNLAVKTLIRQVIQVAHKYGRKVGICGQAPSDYPAFAQFLVAEGIDSISLNPDTVVKTKIKISEEEKKLGIRCHPRENGDPVAKKIATKALSVLGVIGLALMLTGYTCEAVNYNKKAEEIRTEMQTKLNDLKVEMKQELENRISSQTSEYVEGGFANFSLRYPSTWRQEHVGNAIEFEENGGVVFAIGRFEKKKLSEIVGTPIGQIVTTTWFGYETRRYQDSFSGATGTLREVLEVYPNDHEKSKEIIIFMGITDNFDKILNTIKDFKM